MKCYELRSRVDELLEFTPEGERVYEATTKCKACAWPSAAWRANPKPVDLYIRRPPRGPIAVESVFPRVLHARLADVLVPFLDKPLLGRVAIERNKPTDHRGPWITCVPSRMTGIHSTRGLYCRHYPCRIGCGHWGNLIGWASGAVVERTIEGREAFFDNDGEIFITDSLIARLDLKKRFPDLRFYEYPVVPEPLDGEVLPGDPGWNGVFMPQPIPDPPTTKLKRGRHSWP